MKRILSVISVSILFFIAVASSVRADVGMPRIFADNMVLQREMPIPVWGWAEPGEEIVVQFGQAQAKAMAATPSGNWMVRLPATEASAEGRELTVQGKNKLVFKNVVVGEVWLCSGQSNMDWQVHGCATDDGKNADDPNLRFIRMHKNESLFPTTDLPVALSWQSCQNGQANHCTAVGFYFGQRLRKELDVPVGLIDDAWGGSSIDSWIPPCGWKAIPELQGRFEGYQKNLRTIGDRIGSYADFIEGKTDSWDAPRRGANIDRLSQMHNNLIHPLIPYAIRGFIWYQGESNAGEGAHYLYKQQALAHGWRELWNQEGKDKDFPFYFVQLANFMGENDNPEGDYHGWPRIRDAQTKSLSIKNSGMAVIIDIGEANDIHPKNKFDVGDRLALWALAKDYGRKDLVYSGPIYKEMKIEGDSIRLSFDHVGSGLMVGEKDGRNPTVEVKDGKLKRFAVAGENKKWVWADAKIDGETVLVSSSTVEKPVAVRYAWSNNPVGCNLYNKEGLPATPFRTDDW